MPPTGGRVPHVWGDAMATVGMVLNQEEKVPQPGDPMSPGVSPGAKHYIVNYQPYVPMAEWEQLKKKLAGEDMPCKRQQIHEYYAGSEPSLPSAGSRTETSIPLEVHLAVSPVPSLPSSASYPAPTASSASRDVPKIAAASAATRSVGSSSFDAPPALESPTKVAGRMLTHQSPRVDKLPNKAAPISATAADGLEPFAELPKPCEDLESAKRAIAMKISRVRANDVGENPYSRHVEVRRPIADKDRAQYGNGRQMKPARELNVSSKKRLNELLKLPSTRIEAGDLHPSQNFGVIPTQNLRVV